MVELKYVHSIKQLPVEIQSKLEKAVVYSTPEYECYIVKNGAKPLYIYTADFVILVAFFKRYVFKYAQFPVEYYVLNSSETTAQEFLDACINLLKNTFHSQWVSQTNAVVFKAYPSNCLNIPFGTVLVDLTQPEEKIFSKLERRNRNRIRAATNEGVLTKSGGIEFLDDFLKLELDTWDRSSLHPDNKKYYQTLFEVFGNKAIIFIAYKDASPQGGMFLLYNQAMAYAFSSGRSYQAAPGTTKLIHRNAMQYFRSRGVRYFNFIGYRINVDEGSKYAGIQQFKGSFGGDLRQGYMFKVIINKTMYELFWLLVKIKNRNYKGDIIDQEIHKWKELNP
jgi:hypothetical protein